MFNVGGDEPVSHRDLVTLLLETAGTGSATYVDWPPEKKRIDIGSFYSDSTKFRRRSAGSRRSVCARACGARSRSTANTSATTWTFRAPPRKASGDPVPQARAHGRRGRRAGGDRARGRGRVVRARPGARSLRARVRGRVRRATGVGVGTGTDAIAIALRALGVGPGDEVITSPLSAAYSALAIMMTGARPVFADIDAERLTLDPRAVAACVTPTTAAIVPVHIYGQPADMPAIVAVAKRHGLAIVEDCCQAHLATCAGQPVGSFGEAAAYSFYPTKNLGALGDGGALTTADEAIAARARRIRNGGQTDRCHHKEFGVNSEFPVVYGPSDRRS